MKKASTFILNPKFVLSLNIVWGLFGVAAVLGLIPAAKPNPAAFITLLLVACTIFSLLLKTPPKPLLAITILGNLFVLVIGVGAILILSSQGSLPALGFLFFSITLIMLPVINSLAVLNRWAR